MFPVGLVSCDASCRILNMNTQMMQWLGTSDTEAFQGKPFYSVLSAAGRIYFETHIRPLLLVEGRCDEISLDLRDVSGDSRPIYLTGRRRPASQGPVTGFDIVCFGGNERRKYEQELVAQRRGAQAFETLVTAAPDPIVHLDNDMQIVSWNLAAERTFGFTADEVLGRKVTDVIVHPDNQPAVYATRDKIARGEIVSFETTRTHKDGHEIDVELNIAAVRDELGNNVGSVGLMRDITERKRDAQLIDALNREVVHRSKNLMAVVQGIASMTYRHTGHETFMDVFQKRMQSLAQNHALLVDRNWNSIDLHTLFSQQLAHLGPDVAQRIKIAGPRVAVAPAHVEQLGMAIFELSTNAVKYGALCKARGWIEIEWTYLPDAADMLCVTWQEHCVHSPGPFSSDGFGSMLTGRLLEYATGGTVAREMTDAGLRWQLEFRTVVEDLQIEQTASA